MTTSWLAGSFGGGFARVGMAAWGLLMAAGGVGAQEGGGWQELFDGRTLAGWRANEAGKSHRVEDGAIVCEGPRSHLFYVGPVKNAVFQDFELEAEVMAAPGANSGLYFHTMYQESDWPQQGFEVQVNNTATGEGGYVENKKTGSLYGIRNVHKQLVADNAWFRIRIRVVVDHIAVFVNDVQTVRYWEPRGAAPTGGYAGRRLSRGTFALQAHDPKSRVAFRGIRVRPIAPGSERVQQEVRYLLAAELTDLHANNYPVIDLHTHLKGGLTMADILQRQFGTGINAGVALNCGLGFPVTNDAGIDRALAELRHPLVYTAMQAEGREWVNLFSREAMARFDYIFTDAMTIADDKGRRMRLWIPAEVTVEDPQAFMDMLVDRTVRILAEEPVDIWVNPTFLPDVIAKDYATLWTPERMDRVIAAAAKHGVAIEINDRFRLPGLEFIRRAKAAGVKFTFGTNNGGREDLQQLAYCVHAVRECGLKWQDFWVPGSSPRRLGTWRK